MSPTPLPPEPIGPSPISLVAKAQLLEAEMASLLDHIKAARLAFDRAIAAATLRSREQAAELLDSSTAQVGRWTAANELPVVELDRRPRYRLEDIRSFAAARVRHARRSLKTNPAVNGPSPET
jgi:hypothetical protein